MKITASDLPCDPNHIDDFLSAPSAAAVESAATLEGPVGVLGAGGKMGLHLAAMLARAVAAAGGGQQVVAVSRFATPGARDPFARFGVQTIAADLLDDAALGALPDFRTIYFLAGIKFGTADRPDLLRRFNEELPRKVASRFPRAAFVAFSTGCVYPFTTPESGGSTEDDPPDPVGAYARSCLCREREFVEAAHRDGTRDVLIRLNYSVEFRYGVLVDIAARVRAGEPLDLTTGHVNVIWQRDAVDHILRSAKVVTNPAAVLNVAGRPIVAVGDIARRFSVLFGREPIFTGATSPTGWLSNPARAHALFGAPEVAIDTAVGWTAAWLAAGGRTHGKPTGFDRRDGAF